MLIVSIDTLRADRLGCYGYGRDTSPALDRFARDHAVRFENAVAESPWTLPSHVTLLSGLAPLSHGVRTPAGAPGRETELLAERLRRAGAYTFAITDGGWLGERWGFARGFDLFQAEDQDFERTVAEALTIVRQRGDEVPWFGFLHTYDVHCPYDPPEDYARRFQRPDSEPVEVAGRCGNPHFNGMELTEGQRRFLSDRYDADVRRTDDALGRLFAAFDELDLWRDTLVIVTSDHGEEFGEHGQIGHERSLQREVLAIPLLVAAPGVAPRVVAEPVGLADVVPTVLELARGEAAPGLDGRSLVPLLSGERDPGRTGRWSDLGWQRDAASWLTPAEHVILERGGGVRSWDLRADPAEAGPGTPLDGARTENLRAELGKAELARRTPVTLPAGELAPDLRGLGY